MERTRQTAHAVFDRDDKDLVLGDLLVLEGRPGIQVRAKTAEARSSQLKLAEQSDVFA